MATLQKETFFKMEGQCYLVIKLTPTIDRRLEIARQYTHQMAMETRAEYFQYLKRCHERAARKQWLFFRQMQAKDLVDEMVKRYKERPSCAWLTPLLMRVMVCRKGMNETYQLKSSWFNGGLVWNYSKKQ